MKINRDYFKTNKGNMEQQVKILLGVPTVELKVVKVLWDTKNNIGLLQWKSDTIKGLRLIFIENSQVLVRDLSTYYRTTIEECDMLDDLYRSVRHREKPNYIVEYRFR